MTDKYLEVQVKDRIFLAERIFNRHGGYEHSQIVMTHKFLADEAEADGWTVTEYVAVKKGD